MNERIKAILLNSRNTFVNGVTEYNDKVYIHGSEENLEKFAELIIQECAKTVEVYVHESLFNGLYERGYNDGRNASASLIKEHFGVEE